MAENIRPYIVINGKSSREISGLLISSLPPITKPQMRVTAEEIDGRDGDIVTELGFSAYDKPVEIGLAGDYDINEVISYFNQAGIITFSNEPDKYYRFAQYNGIDFEKLIRFKTATVIFHVQPFKYDTESNDAVFWNPENISITNEGNIYSKPELAIQGSGNVGIALNGSEVLSLELGNTQQAIIIDSDKMNAYGTKSNVKELITDINPVQEGTGEPSPTNVREITGWNGCVVSRTGVNLWDEQWELGIYNTTTGLPQTSNYSIRGKNRISVKPNTSFYANNNLIRRLYYDINDNFISFKAGIGVDTTPSNCYYMRIYLADTYGTTYNNDISINYPSSDTEYHKFVGSKYQTFFEGLMAGTYGVVDLGTLTWTYEPVGTSQSVSFGVMRATLSPSPLLSGNLLCEKFEGVKGGVSSLLNNQCCISGTQAYPFLRIRCDEYSDATEFQTAMSGVYLIYELATATAPTITQPDINGLISAFGADLNAIVFGQTVFGGSLNVTTGLLTVTHAIVDLGDLTWTYAIDINRFYSNEQIAIKHPASTSEIPFILCSHYQTLSWDNFQVASNDYCISNPNSNGRINIRDTHYTDATAFKTAMSGVQLVYELATSIEIQLTAEEIQTLIGTSNIWSNIGDISECIYTRAGTDVTTSGAIVTFEADASDLRDDILKNRLVTGNYDNLRLKAGSNQIGITGDVDVLVLSNFSRWL